MRKVQGREKQGVVGQAGKRGRQAALASVALIALLCHSVSPALAADAASMTAGAVVEVASFDPSLLPPPPPAVRPPPAARPMLPESPSAAKQGGDVHAPAPADFSRWGGREWLLEKRNILGDAPDMVRYVANECVLAGVAGAAIAIALSVSGGAVGPVAAAALGVSPEMSTMGITALGCVAGGAAGIASAVAIYAYEEPETVRDFAVASAYGVQYAATTAAETVVGALSKPQDVLYAAASGVQWAASGVVAGVAGGVGAAANAVAGATQATAGAVITAAAAGIGGWWAGKPAEPAAYPAYDVASAAVVADDPNAARVY